MWACASGSFSFPSDFEAHEFLHDIKSLLLSSHPDFCLVMYHIHSTPVCAPPPPWGGIVNTNNPLLIPHPRTSSCREIYSLPTASTRGAVSAVAEASSRSRALFAWESDHLLLGVGRNVSVRESPSDERQRVSEGEGEWRERMHIRVHTDKIFYNYVPFRYFI